MLFNSLTFLIFFCLVFIVYWILSGVNYKWQNILLLVSSCIFYGWWNYRFLSLILLSSIVDFFSARIIFDSSNEKKRKAALIFSVLFNVGMLLYFKYLNFFLDSFNDILAFLNYEKENFNTLDIILPVGISFYTFQTMSYTIDVYKEKIEPTKDFLSFTTYISFFPQLVAGPIERAKDLLNQIQNKRQFNYDSAINGTKLVIWGLFKKVVIADSLAPFVNQIFSNYDILSGGDLLLGVIYFTIQIYCDFSGYSDIAIGIAALLGINLNTNFYFPYFTHSISDFWKKWHISLTSWFRDYLYIPLGGSKVNKRRAIRNILIVFLVSGLWHGANWTFIIWGLIHFMFFVFDRYVLQNKNINFFWWMSFILTWVAILIGWTFFRSADINQGIFIVKQIIFDFQLPQSRRFQMVYIILLLFLEYRLIINNQFKEDIKIIFFKNKYFNIACIYVLICFLFSSSSSNQEFIYFQF